MGYALRGILLVYSNSKLRGYALRPLWWAMGAYLALGLAGYWLVVPWVSGMLSSLPMVGDYAESLGAAAYVLAWILLAGVVYVGMAGWLSSLLWDPLSLEVERQAGIEPSGKALGCGASIGDTLFRMALSLVVSVGGFFLGLFTLGLGSLSAAGYLGTLDFTANAYARRGMTVGPQMGSVFKLPGARQFAFASGLVGLLPFLGIFLLPGMVAGGTLMVLDAEKQGRLPR